MTMSNFPLNNMIGCTPYHPYNICQYVQHEYLILNLYLLNLRGPLKLTFYSIAHYVDPFANFFIE